MDPQQLATALATAFQSIDISKPQLPSFEPATQDINEWLLKFEASTKGKTDTEKISILPLVLQNAALQWYAIRKSTIVPTTTWAEIERELKQEFAKNLCSIIQELHLRTQRENETAIDYCRDVIRLCLSYNSQMSEIEKVAHLMRGISATLRDKLILMQPKTSSEFMTNVNTLEASKQMSSNYDPQKVIETLTLALIDKNKASEKATVVPQLYQQPTNDPLHEIQQQLSTMQEKMMLLERDSKFNHRYSNLNQRGSNFNHHDSNYNHSRNGSFRNLHGWGFRPQSFYNPNGQAYNRPQNNVRSRVRCHNCGKIGHFARDLPAKVGHNVTDCIMDSGSKRNIISYEFAKKNNCKISPVSTLLRVVNGSLVQPQGEVVLDLQIGNEFYELSALVVKNFPYDMLLGIDFWNDAKVNLNFENKTLKIGSFVHQIDCSFFDPAPVLVCVNKDTLVPRFSERVLRVRTRSKAAQLMIESSPTSFTRYGIMVCKTITSINNYKGFVRVCNPTNKDIILPKEAKIGSGCEFLDEQLCYFSTDSKYNPYSENNHCSKTDHADSKLNHDSKFNHDSNFDHLFKSNLGDQLSTEERKKLIGLMQNFSDIFSKSSFDLGKTTVLKHSIDTGTHDPIRQAPYRKSYKEREELRKEVNKLLEHNLIREST
ncbi:hypothetical protein B4U80_13260, partial [Leptotrombidium deliense]